ncbi:MAG: tellurite resistance/C4-dicarboxylate transporter family protein [Candidatus Hydrogenedentes bacterium]|nr:tellurite resistance/C4-dicarboxylate transporter family protein [Candidatus Hydrogenedentota bacterium]
MELARTSHPGPDCIRLRPIPLRQHLEERIAGMHPAYFALVMATGIVAIGAHLLGLGELAWLLGRINWVAYPLLWLLMLARLAWFPGRVWADCASHQRAPGFFTIVAATSVFGVQVKLLHGNPSLAIGLWWLTLVLWATANYGIFTLLITRDTKPTLAAGIHGGWLVAIVAAQSVVVLGCITGVDMLGSRDITLFALLCFWLCGGILYLWIISLIFYRYLFFTFSPTDLMPPYWINMGAVAISTLAGALIALAAEGSPLLEPLLPFIKGGAIMYWATATWWIPMLLLLGVWRHLVKGFPIAYDPLYWGLVFPLGMYAVCTLRLQQVLDAPFLLPIAKVFIVAAAMAWLVTFLGLVRRLLFGCALACYHLRSVRVPAPAHSPLTNKEELDPNEYCPCPNRS